MVGDITWVRCSYKSVRGNISVAWRRDGETRGLDVTIPPNTSAVIHVPTPEGATISESGKPAGELAGVELVEKLPGVTVYQVGSGTYRFESK
jgi:alpha-L-rhamnosidase